MREHVDFVLMLKTVVTPDRANEVLAIHVGRPRITHPTQGVEGVSASQRRAFCNAIEGTNEGVPHCIKVVDYLLNIKVQDTRISSIN